MIAAARARMTLQRSMKFASGTSRVETIGKFDQFNQFVPIAHFPLKNSVGAFRAHRKKAIVRAHRPSGGCGESGIVRSPILPVCSKKSGRLPLENTKQTGFNRRSFLRN